MLSDLLLLVTSESLESEFNESRLTFNRGLRLFARVGTPGVETKETWLLFSGIGKVADPFSILLSSASLTDDLITHSIS